MLKGDFLMKENEQGKKAYSKKLQINGQKLEKKR